MDFKGQKLSELMYQICLYIFGVVGFVVGFATGSFRNMMLIYGVGVMMAIVIAVPDWPYFNQNPQRWLAVDESAGPERDHGRSNKRQR